jgi:hypothetical protein
MTVVCTAIRWLTPLSALVRQQSRPSKECVTDRNNRQILLSQMWHLVLRGEFAYKLSNKHEVLVSTLKFEVSSARTHARLTFFRNLSSNVLFSEGKPT